jgi:hypothetical protein
MVTAEGWEAMRLLSACHKWLRDQLVIRILFAQISEDFVDRALVWSHPTRYIGLSGRSSSTYLCAPKTNLHTTYVTASTAGASRHENKQESTHGANL